MQKKDIPLDQRIIFALDLDTEQKAQEWVSLLSHRITYYKVGMELFLAGGWRIVDWILQQGHQVMLDLKLYDVPRTVQASVQQIRHRPVSTLTVHGDQAILESACEASGRTKILAVTVLTRLESDSLLQMGFSGSPGDLALQRARMAQEAGCTGIVCSGLELPQIRSQLGSALLAVVPGVRAHIRPEDDQKRTVDLVTAFDNGADHVVLGRPIREAEDPQAFVEGLQEKIASTLASGQEDAS